MIKLADKNKCTGCLSCYNSCNHGAIRLIEDKEGFIQPSINSTICTNCGLCASNCPELKERIIQPPLDLKAFAIINYKDAKTSSSGGAFSLLARWVLSKNGLVYGACMDGNGDVRHISINSSEDLDKLKGSKYVQSYIGNIFKEIRQNLLLKRKVLFVGTPCQVEGLYSFLKMRYDNLLYTVDLVCHGIPSNASFKSYIKKLSTSRKLNDYFLSFFKFRKLDGWAISPSVKFEELKELHLDLSDNAYMNAYFKNLLFRSSCYECQYCNIDRVGTFTIADYWGIGKNGKKFKGAVTNGVSLLLDNRGIFNNIKSEFEEVFIEERPLEEAIKGQFNLNSTSEKPNNRESSVIDLLNPNISLTEYSKKYHLPYKKSFRWAVSHSIKMILLRFGWYNNIKAFIYNSEFFYKKYLNLESLGLGLGRPSPLRSLRLGLGCV